MQRLWSCQLCVINLLTEEFAEDNKDKGNSLPKITEKTNKFTNERLYGVKKSNIDYEVLKKKNKLTEYICLIKAKNNLEMENLNQNFFNLNKWYSNTIYYLYKSIFRKCQ